METVTCFHIPSFPCWVETWLARGTQTSQPRGGPVSGSHRGTLGDERAVAVYDHDTIIAVSPSLARQGVRIGESLARARMLVPDATFSRHDPHREEAVWEDLLHLLADVAPRLRPFDTGSRLLKWAVLDPFDRAALTMLNRSLGGKIGIGVTRCTAMLAALHAVPGETYIVAERETRQFHNHASIHHLAAFGFDEEMLERLRLFGLHTVGRVIGLTRRHLKAQFGATGAALFDLLHPAAPESPVPLFQPPPTISAEYHFDDPVLEPAELVPVLDHLLVELTERLAERSDALQGQLLTLRLATADCADPGRAGGGEGTRALRRLLKSPTARLDHLRVIAHTMLAEMIGRPEWRIPRLTPPDPVEAIRVELGGLVQRGGVQGGLFEHRPDVDEAVKTIHRRFPGRLVRAVITDPHSYIPEKGIRFEPYPETPPLLPRRTSSRMSPRGSSHASASRGSQTPRRRGTR